MGLFKKKNDGARKSLVDSAHDVKHEVEGEMLSAEAGLAIDEIERLLELLGRENRERPVYRRRAGNVLDLVKRLAFWLRADRMTLEQAQEFVHAAVEEQQQRHQNRLNKKQPSDEEDAEVETLPLQEIIYPRKLSPDDVLNATKTIRQILTDEAPREERESEEERRARKIFEALEQLKNEEAARFARCIASKQRQQILAQAGLTDNLPTNGGIVAAGDESVDEETLERIRTLEGFGKKPLKTLIDEAGNIVDEDAGAAAKVLKQWIGNAKSEGD